ncbi:MAG: hypothetical protein ACLU99_01935 [Alphaproteobacteria bacterium]
MRILWEMNKAVTTTINGLLKIWQQPIWPWNTYSNYSAYDFSTPEEDEERLKNNFLGEGRW